MMKDGSCLGCRTYFEEGERLPLLGIFTEFRNYELPIKDNKQRWGLLRTLTGFLNSRGGTIFIGVDQSQGEVMGIPLNRKQQDEFLLFIKDFVQKIKPNVDLVNREQIIIVYVPVVSLKVFKGKYVIKLIVRQGDPARTYHFAQKIELEVGGRIEEYEIYHAFGQTALGTMVEFKGEGLLQQIGRKACSPNELAGTFHKFCNPDPLKLQGALTKIGFAGIQRQQLRIRLQQIFHGHLQAFDIEYELTYDIENQVLLVEFENKEQFRQINKFVRDQLPALNQKGFAFEERGEYLDFYLYQNVRGKEVSVIKEQVKKGEGKKIGSPQKEDSNETWEYVGGQQELPHPRGAFSSIRELCQDILTKEPVLTITHINTEKKEALFTFLNGFITDKSQIVFSKYLHTFQLSFDSLSNVLSFNELLKRESERLGQFGVHRNLVVGINMRSIRIRNYDRNKRRELKQYLGGKMGSEVAGVQFKKEGNKFFLECRFVTRELTCSWLQQLLGDASIRQFVIPGAEMGRASKMRIYIYCLCG